MRPDCPHLQAKTQAGRLGYALPPHSRRYFGESRVAFCERKVEGGGIGGGPMMRLTREDGQTLAGYVLILAPATIVVALALALVVLTGK